MSTERLSENPKISILILGKLSEECLNKLPDKGCCSYHWVDFDCGVDDSAWLAEAVVVTSHRRSSLSWLVGEPYTCRLVDIEHVGILVPTIWIKWRRWWAVVELARAIFLYFCEYLFEFWKGGLPEINQSWMSNLDHHWTMLPVEHVPDCVWLRRTRKSSWYSLDTEVRKNRTIFQR